MDYIQLVNKTCPLSCNYIPENLIVTDNNENNFHHYVNPDLKPMINKTVFEQFRRLQTLASKENIFFIVDSGYRSYDYQKEVFDSISKEKGIEYANEFVAPPGCSEHQTGLAIDIAAIRDDKYSDDIKDGDKEVEWLKDNAHKYGFILRYPKGKEEITGYSFEPWHFRYVGETLATFLHSNNLTMEEYYQNKIQYDSMMNYKKQDNEQR